MSMAGTFAVEGTAGLAAVSSSEVEEMSTDDTFVLDFVVERSSVVTPHARKSWVGQSFG